MATTVKSKCLRCGNLMTWADQKRQYGRLMRAGVSNDKIREVQPRCQKCVTILLRLGVDLPLGGIWPCT